VARSIGVRIKDKDKGYKKMLKRVLAQQPKEVSVGIFDAEASQVHEEPQRFIGPVQEGAEAPNPKPRKPMTVGEIAEIHEYGLGNNPERSFIRAWVDENPGKIRAAMTRLLESVIKGKRTKETAMNAFGLWAAGQMQKRIAAGIAPGLSPVTILRKGSAIPLIDTGQLRASITYQVKFTGS